MKRRLFLRLLLVLLLLPGWALAEEEREMRGLWIDAWGVGFLNASQVTQLVNEARANNFNALFVQMRRRGDAFYMPQAPNMEPRTTAVAANFDALADLIAKAHGGTPRLEVHCWVTTHLIWSNQTSPPPQAEHVFNLHPEFLMKNRAGETYLGEGYYLDPGHPEAMQWTYRMAMDIVSRYAIDGFHWDYIRNPMQDSGFNDVAVARFNAEFNRTGLPAANDAQFSAWRRRQNTDFMRWVNAELLEVKPELVISAAVFANRSDAFTNRHQDWAAWNQAGSIDLCVPMNYVTNNSTFLSRTNDALAHRGVRQVYIGQGAYLNPRETTVAQLQTARDRGAGGTVFYSYRVPNSGTVDRAGTLAYVRDQYQPTWVETPLIPWKTTTGIVKGTVRDRETGALVYNATVSLVGPSALPQLSCVQGGYAFYNLPGQTVTLTARLGELVATETVEVMPGAVIHLDLLLAEGEPPPPEPATVVLMDFEDQEADGGSGLVLFRNPTFSGTNNGNLLAQPNSSVVTANRPAGAEGAQSLRVRFAFQEGLANPWLRLTTHGQGGSILPTPIIPFDRYLVFDVFPDRDLYVAIGLRDNGATGAIGESGGADGGIEWVGGVTDNVRAGLTGNVPPLGRLVPAGKWTRLYFHLPTEPVKAFTGNGALTFSRGVLEHLAFVPVVQSPGIYDAGPYEVFLDHFFVTTEPPPEPLPPSFGTWAELWLPDEERGPQHDPGGFGIPNLLRYALGLDPLQPARGGLPFSLLTRPEGKGARLQLQYTRRTDDPALVILIEASSDLVTWAIAGGEEKVEPAAGGLEAVIFTDAEEVENQPARYLRIRVE